MTLLNQCFCNRANAKCGFSAAHTRSKDKVAAAEAAKASKTPTKKAPKRKSTASSTATTTSSLDANESSPTLTQTSETTGEISKHGRLFQPPQLPTFIPNSISPSKGTPRARGSKHATVPVMTNRPLPTPDPTPDDTPMGTPLPQPEVNPEELLPDNQSLPSYATSAATKVLQKQLKEIIKLQLRTNLGHERYWTLDLSRLDDLYTWYFTLSTFDPDIPLSKDLQKFNLDSVHLQVKFGPQHPSTPPFVRVIKPRFMQWMNGGGGHVTAGGSICIDMLTMKGWKKNITVDMVLMVVHQALSDLDPVPARVIGAQEYGIREAVNAYIRVANTHGWRVPQNWNSLFLNS